MPAEPFYKSQGSGKPDERIEGVEKGHPDQIGKNPFSVKGDSSVKKKKEEELKDRRKGGEESGVEAQVERFVVGKMVAEAVEKSGRYRVVEGVDAHRVFGEEVDERTGERAEPERFGEGGAERGEGDGGSECEDRKVGMENALED